MIYDSTLDDRGPSIGIWHNGIFPQKKTPFVPIGGPSMTRLCCVCAPCARKARTMMIRMFSIASVFFLGR
jgi:hypothetical protein